MARFEVTYNSVTSLIADLERAAHNIPELRDLMLDAEVNIVKPALQSAVTVYGLVDTGKLRDSIGESKRAKGSIRMVGPKGTHHRYIPVSGDGDARSGHIGYIFEYGFPGRGIYGRLWMSRTVKSVADKAVDAAETAHDEYMKNHNL